MSLVVDFVLLGGTNLVLVIWGLIHVVNSVFRQILPRKTVNAFCTASFTSRYKFSYNYSVFTHVASIYANLLEQKKAFA